MDWMKLKENLTEYLKKYRYVLIVLLAGMVLMLLPETKAPAKETVVKEDSEESAQASLEKILSQMEGAGKVSVLLTEKKGQQILYQTDEDTVQGETSQDIHKRTVVVTDTSRQETGLVRQILPPVLQGAVVLCQGAEDPKIRLAIVEAVMRATGLPSNCICVLKMK